MALKCRVGKICLYHGKGGKSFTVPIFSCRKGVNLPPVAKISLQIPKFSGKEPLSFPTFSTHADMEELRINPLLYSRLFMMTYASSLLEKRGYIPLPLFLEFCFI